MVFVRDCLPASQTFPIPFHFHSLSGGFKVVLHSDGRAYTRTPARGAPMDNIASLIVMNCTYSELCCRDSSAVSPKKIERLVVNEWEMLYASHGQYKCKETWLP